MLRRRTVNGKAISQWRPRWFAGLVVDLHPVKVAVLHVDMRCTTYTYSTTSAIGHRLNLSSKCSKCLHRLLDSSWKRAVESGLTLGSGDRERADCGVRHGLLNVGWGLGHGQGCDDARADGLSDLDGVAAVVAVRASQSLSERAQQEFRIPFSTHVTLMT